MSKLNCSIGDLAITVKANLPANLGNIVRIARIKFLYKTTVYIFKNEMFIL
jgi:hypothetical protein